MVSVKPLDGAFGVSIENIDLIHGIDADTMNELTQTLYEHRVIVLRHQCLAQETFLQFGRQWGSTIPHVLEHMQMPGYPELMAIANTQ